jgi:hypothetical protein
MYTVIYITTEDSIVVKSIESSEELSNIIEEIVDEVGLEPEDKDFEKDLNKYILLFEGDLEPKPIVIKPRPRFEVVL